MPSMRIAAIVFRDLEEALKAGGADIVIAVENPSEAITHIENIIREKKADLILVDDKIVARIGKGKLKEIKYKYPVPAIVELETQNRK
ncbi:hypothetical protein [Thermofilum sp.]|jgi:vacuolar-type H+-ATPase subunit F/Vma7|uniref:hypothetical protein n=1 Tax=Thermofilum sp. TaxID=1961369 RepID=UPI00142B3A97|nr:hypothetical protein [Thermofilum sp.]NAZ24787.1 hypothetical protein [Thermofilum sp.]